MDETKNNDGKRKSRNGTRLNKELRNGLGINSRKYGRGLPVVVAVTRGGRKVRFLDQETANGGNVTPFNIQCISEGACAIRKVILDEKVTTVLFDDGDRVQVNRHPNDKDDPVTAVMWALGKKVFGEELSRQIERALKYRSVRVKNLREEKDALKRVKAFDTLRGKPVLE